MKIAASSIEARHAFEIEVLPGALSQFPAEHLPLCTLHATRARCALALTIDNVWQPRLAKHFQSANARVRWELIAALNHPNHANPAVNIATAALVSVISAVAGDVAVLDQSGPRRFRMGLTMEW